MKHIQNYTEYINENIKHIDKINMKYVLDEIQFIDISDIKTKKSKNYTHTTIVFTDTSKEIKKLLKEKLNELQNTLLNDGIMLSYFINYDEVEIYFKRTDIGIVPTQYVYHVSSVDNRKDISKYGLYPKSSDESKRWNHAKYAYPKAIFATMVNQKTGLVNPFGSGNGFDIWQIDTSKLSNKWFIDLNYTGEKDNCHIMTFEPIPHKYLKLAKQG